MTVLFFVTNWCPDCVRSRRVLQRLRIEYDEIDIEAEAGAEERMRSYNGGSGKVPTVVIETAQGQTVLVEPDNRELTEALCANQ